MKINKNSEIHEDVSDVNSKKFMVNAISKQHTSTMSQDKVDIPIIILDDDDDDNLKISKDYKFFLDHLKDDDNGLGPLLDLDHSCRIRYEADSGRSETRELKNENSLMMKKSIKRESVGCKAEFSRVREQIQRDNRVAERRKRRLAEVEAVGLVRNEESIRKDSEVRKFSDLKVKTLGDAQGRNKRLDEVETVGLVRNEESIRQDSEVRKVSELKGETLGDAQGRKKRLDEVEAVRLVRNEESIRQDSEVRKVSELKGETLGDVRLDDKVSEGRKRRLDEVEAVWFVRNHESIRRDSEVRKFSDLKVKTFGDASSVRIEDHVQRDNGRKWKHVEVTAEILRRSVSLDRTEEEDIQVDERRKRRIVETTNANEASKVVPANETSRIAQETRRKEEESVAVVDKCYMSYLTWLVNSLKDHEDSRVSDTVKEAVTVPEEDLLVEVKLEQQDLESLSDDSDIIAVGDSPFSDGESTPFVSSKSVVVDLERKTNGDESSCWFRKELLEELKRPYNEAELKRLYRDVSIHRKMTRCRELRKGREADYETDTLGKSYLEQFKDFHQVYKSVDHNDKASALKLLRGFFFYLKNVSHDGAFKPWIDH